MTVTRRAGDARPELEGERAGELRALLAPAPARLSGRHRRATRHGPDERGHSSGSDAALGHEAQDGAEAAAPHRERDGVGDIIHGLRTDDLVPAEAREHGIAPVGREYPAYRFMRNVDGDGVVCE